MSGKTLSSTAQRCYWLGRYLERAESTGRLIRVNTNLLIDLPMRLPNGWAALLDITGAREVFDDLYDEPTEQHVTHFLISDLRNPGSIFTSINQAKENARTVRGNMPNAFFEYVNELQINTKQALSEPLSRTRRISGLLDLIEAVEQIDGFLSANMLHDDAWGFLRLGNFVERADMTTRIIDVRTRSLSVDDSDLDVFADIQWRSVLKSLNAMQSYNSVVQAPVNQNDALTFLLQNDQLPRSYARCLRSIRNGLRDLPRNEAPLRSANRMLRNISNAQLNALAGEELHDFLDARQQDLAGLHQDINRTYFNTRPTMRRRKQKPGPKKT
jgi:uncharacterized alpha-E superfamily protein